MEELIAYETWHGVMWPRWRRSRWEANSLGKISVKMLTQMHMVVYTWWCWHIYKWGGVPRVERGLGSSALLRKLSTYFLLRLWEIWRSAGVNTHRTLTAEAPDAEPVRLVCCQCLALLGLGTRRRLNPACASGAAWLLRVPLTKSTGSGRVR